MRWHAFITVLVICLHASAFDEFPAPVNTQTAGEHPPSPREMLDLFELPEGFRVTLFAGDPDVQQPIAFDFDDRGRIWVAENYTYAARGKVDQLMRDRVIILHDNDGDGEHDDRKVFWDKGKMLTGLTWGYGGLWILNDGTLSYIADENGDDMPDGEPVEMLNGWTKNAGHNVVNGLLWGPDGWLYGRHGITDTSLPGTPDTPKDERDPINCGIWRFHPMKHTFEIVCHGTTNPWGLDYNEYGDMFMTNNVIGHLWHVIPGAHYERMFGQDFNPHCYELMGQCADHYHWDNTGKWSESRDGKAADLGGGHSHCGGMIYYGDNFPKEYRGKIFMCNTHGRCVNVNRLERKGSTYVGKREPNFLKVNTPWFRGVELKYGPRGCVYLTDWSDNGECHDHDGVHRTSGRIYRISYGKVRPAKPYGISRVLKRQPLESLSTGTLYEGSLNTAFHSVWDRRRFQRLLFERIYAFQSLHPNLATTDAQFWSMLNTQKHPGLESMHGDELGPVPENMPPQPDIDPFRIQTLEPEEQRAHSFANFLCSVDAVTPAMARRLLLSGHETVRKRMVSHLFETPDLLSQVRETFYGVLRINTSAGVALAYASGLQKLPPTSFAALRDRAVQNRLRDRTLDCNEVLTLLTAQTPSSKFLNDDKTLRLMTWYAAVHHSLFGLDPRCPCEELLAFGTRLTVEKTNVSDPEDLVIRMSLDGLVTYRNESNIPHVRSQLQAILDGIEGRSGIAVPKSWDVIREGLNDYNDSKIDELTNQLASRFGDKASFGALRELINDRSAKHVARSRAIEAL